ncbi:MAG: hypothetical protein FJX77_15495, partial [Armatimonadetes bacterium]|nr:hypothetical protein [Armatimonadota bacterium]
MDSERCHPRRARAWLLGSGGLLLTVLAVLATAFVSKPWLQRARLADGTEIVLEGYRYGYQYVTDPLPYEWRHYQIFFPGSSVVKSDWSAIPEDQIAVSLSQTRVPHDYARGFDLLSDAGGRRYQLRACVKRGRPRAIRNS